VAKIPNKKIEEVLTGAFSCEYTLTINVPLILKVREVIFLADKTHEGAF
jgi:hypothetical protein